jgi:hypothetical protein
LIAITYTYLKSDRQTVISQEQYHGKIVSADREFGFQLECSGAWLGKTMKLPPGAGAFSPAERGVYQLSSSGEMVSNPDVIARWRVAEPIES